jgi:imidazolonepropionase-like amidohydrolase
VLLRMKDGIITAITPYEAGGEADALPTADLSYAVLCPPFVDCHVHLAFSGTTDLQLRRRLTEAGYADIRPVIRRHIADLFVHGVLAARDAGDRHELLQRYGKEQVTAGAPPVVISAAAQAEYGGGKVIIAANGREPVRTAIAAGCHAIVHGCGMGRDNLERMAEREVVLVPTLQAMKAAAEQAADAAVKKLAAKALATQLEQVALARELGVTVALGTDAGSPGVLHGEAVVEELKLLIRAGFSLTEAVRCATVNGADLLGLDRGRIAVGSRADFLVARGTPAQLPRKFSYLEAIWLAGRPSPIYQKNPQRSER